MIVRIVKMNFKHAHIQEFLEIFEKQKNFIKGFDGCTHLELLRDERNPNIFFTYSHWKDASCLELYRESDFFINVWSKVKLLFDDKPMAWSTKRISLSHE